MCKHTWSLQLSPQLLQLSLLPSPGELPPSASTHPPGSRVSPVFTSHLIPPDVWKYPKPIQPKLKQVPAIPALRRLRQEGSHDSKASLSCTPRFKPAWTSVKILSQNKRKVSGNKNGKSLSQVHLLTPSPPPPTNYSFSFISTTWFPFPPHVPLTCIPVCNNGLSLISPGTAP